MNLREALTIATYYTDPKATDQNLHVVVLRDGHVRATNRIAGCAIPVDGIDKISMAVDCAALRRMVNAIGDDAELKPGKGRKLMIKGPGASYNLKAIPEAAEPTFPKTPGEKAGWVDVAKPAVQALTSITQVIDPKAPNPAFLGVHMTPHWCGVATTQMIAFAWIGGLVTKGFTAPPQVFTGLTAAIRMAVAKDRLYIHDPKTGQVRWSLGIAGAWPDDSMSQALVDSRAAKRQVATVKLDDLRLLAKQAAVVSQNLVHAFKITMDKKGINLTGTQALGDFTGHIPIGKFSDADCDNYLGIEPSRLDALASVVQAGGGDAFIAISGPIMPMMIWNAGDEDTIVVETLTMPMRLQE